MVPDLSRRSPFGIAAHFHRMHEDRYGYAQPENIVEVVSARLRSLGIVAKLPQVRGRTSKSQHVKPGKNVTAYFAGKKVGVGVYDREALPAGARMRAPCIVTEYSATTLIPAGATAAIDGYGNLIIQVT